MGLFLFSLLDFGSTYESFESHPQDDLVKVMDVGELHNFSYFKTCACSLF